MYKKRQGTSGIKGQLYETKLLSLLLFRARHNDDIEKFHLGTNVDDIGVFDDICFRAKVKGTDRPLAVFIQAKHRENNRTITLNSKNDLTKYFDSYLRIRKAFESNDNELFGGDFNDTDSLFVLYTTAKADHDSDSSEFKHASIVNDLIGTHDSVGFNPFYNDETVEFLCTLVVKEQIAALAIQIAKLLYKEVDFKTFLNNEVVLRYHVFLAQKVFIISGIEPAGHRLAIFRDKFFISNEVFVRLFRENLFTELLKRRKVDEKMVSLYLYLYNIDSPDGVDLILSELIGSVITYNKHEKLEFIDPKTPEHLKQQLSKVDVSESTVNAAIHLAAKKILLVRVLSVPAAFGNIDLTIRGNDEKIEKRLNYLTQQIVELINNHTYNVVTIDETVGKGLLQVNGGIAGAVGNILVQDENTKLMKFTDTPASLGELAKRLYNKLTLKINDLQKYRFEAKVKNFAQFSFIHCDHDRHMIKEFLNKLVFYTNQADEYRVEEILKHEIGEYQYEIGDNFRIKSDAIFLTYHDEIQKWWMSSTEGMYLTKDTETQDTISKIVHEPLMTIVHAIYRNKIKCINYTFNEDSLPLLGLEDELLNAIIVTDTVALTVAKLLQYLIRKDHSLIDLEYLSNLPIHDCNVLCAELMNTSKNKILILVYDCATESRNQSKTLEKIKRVVHDKSKIVITNQQSISMIKKHFSPTDNVIHDQSNNLSDMSDESRKDILEKSMVIFQDVQVNLGAIIDDVSLKFIEGDVLKNVLNRRTIVVGKSLRNSSYDEIKHLYVNRSVRRGGKPRRVQVDIFDMPIKTGKKIKFLNDLKDDVVLITAKPGMGKSTLLTHLSISTKENDPSVWIVRINLLDYSKQFSQWQDGKVNIDSLETLKFICQVVTNENNGNPDEVRIALEESDGEVKLKDCTGDPCTVFEIKLFLHFYNNKNIIFLFDGFDEICPKYIVEVMQLLKIVRTYPRKHKMWIASRSYNNIKFILKREFGIPYEIEEFSSKEKDNYLMKYWRYNLVLNEMDSEKIKNVYDFLKYMKDMLDSIHDFKSVNKLPNLPLQRIYFSAFDYLRHEVKFAYIPLWTYNEYFEGIIYDEIFAALRIQYNGNHSEIDSMKEFVSTPLHLYLIAEYFQIEIKDVTKKTNKWNLDINTYNIYDKFLEMKLKKIRFENKNKVDTYIADNLLIYESVRSTFVVKHKMIAAFAMFHREDHELFSRRELKEIKNMIKFIKKGGEKSGLIYSIKSSNTPIFVHRTFAEYFAIEYFCDKLKSEESTKKQESMMYFIFNVIFFHCPANVRNILDSKIKMDAALMMVFQKHDEVIFDLLMEQTKGYEAYDISDITDEHYRIKFDFSLNLALSHNLKNFVQFFMAIIEKYLDETNVDKFIKMIYELKMLYVAIKVKCEEFIVFAIDIVKKINVNKFSELFPRDNFSFFVDLSLKTKEELLQILRAIVRFTSTTNTPYFMHDRNNESIIVIPKYRIDAAPELRVVWRL